MKLHDARVVLSSAFLTIAFGALNVGLALEKLAAGIGTDRAVATIVLATVVMTSSVCIMLSLVWNKARRLEPAVAIVTRPRAVDWRGRP